MCKWYEFHNWKNVEQLVEYEFMGEICKKTVPTGYRKCTKCGIIKQFHYDSQGGSWSKVSQCETNVIDLKIEEALECYFLEPKPPKVYGDKNHTPADE